MKRRLALIGGSAIALLLAPGAALAESRFATGEGPALDAMAIVDFTIVIPQYAAVSLPAALPLSSEQLSAPARAVSNGGTMVFGAVFAGDNLAADPKKYASLEPDAVAMPGAGIAKAHLMKAYQALPSKGFIVPVRFNAASVAASPPARTAAGPSTRDRIIYTLAVP